ncbi:MAG: DUF58 domain-containing protein [Nocardioidaceae bacterium]|nr:DUF58 domain-containing protein [Nocardioidaceae bacterium]MCL2614930.1 DUF58 domain-containing protein [Nocardioidaceae bacterium]
MPTLRAAMDGLTLRGRAFLAAGATVVVCALLLGQDDLVRIGALVLALPLLAAAYVGLRRHEVATSRSISRPVVPAGTPCEVEVTLSRSGGVRAGDLLVEEQVPYALGTRPRFLLHGLGRDRERHVTYPVRSDVRGRFEVGPLTSRLSDPFGLVEVRRTHPGTATITVTPPVLALPTIDLGTGRRGTGDHHSSLGAAGSPEDATVRDYRRGDDLRRVHWRSSARTGELMVRREEQPWEARATLLLDNRAVAHLGRGLASSLETAVVLAASIAVHLDAHGYAVRLVTADGPASRGTEPVAAVLERLAVVGTSSRTTLDAVAAGDAARGLVAGVLGSAGDDDRAALRRIRQDAGTALALALDVEQWRPRGEVTTGLGAAVGPLLASGWRATAVGRHHRPAQAWRELGARRAVTR